ncbi:MAG TPA: WS/DGAT domain-containing protein, partial [Acidimicrobiales bacterium]
SNVPGPDFPLYFGGAELQAGFPLGPVMDGLGVNITIMSYRGVLYWGMMACPEAIPKVWNLAAAIPLALDELLDAAGLGPATYRSTDAADAVRAAGIDVPDVPPPAVGSDRRAAKKSAARATRAPDRKPAAKKAAPAKKAAAHKTAPTNQAAKKVAARNAAPPVDQARAQARPPLETEDAGPSMPAPSDAGPSDAAPSDAGPSGPGPGSTMGSDAPTGPSWP